MRNSPTTTNSSVRSGARIAFPASAAQPRVKDSSTNHSPCAHHSHHIQQASFIFQQGVNVLSAVIAHRFSSSSQCIREWGSGVGLFRAHKKCTLSTESFEAFDETLRFGSTIRGWGSNTLHQLVVRETDMESWGMQWTLVGAATCTNREG